jgi:hypothetical protein
LKNNKLYPVYSEFVSDEGDLTGSKLYLCMNMSILAIAGQGRAEIETA